MTRKDYQLIAEAIVHARKACISFTAQEGVNKAADELSHALKKDNPRFDRHKFLVAAGMMREED